MKILLAGNLSATPTAGNLSTPTWANLDSILSSMDQEFKEYQVLYCEGLFYFGHTSNSKASAAPGISSMLSMIAGEKINKSSVQPALRKRAEELRDGLPK